MEPHHSCCWWQRGHPRAEPHAQARCHVPTAGAGTAWPRPFMVPWETPFSLPCRPWGPCHPPLGLLQATCDPGGVRTGRSRAAISPHPGTILVPTVTCLPGAGRSTGLHQLSSWKKKKPSFLSGAIWGGWAFIPEPGQRRTPSRWPWPWPSSHGGRGAGAPSLQRRPSTCIPQPRQQQSGSRVGGRWRGQGGRWRGRGETPAGTAPGCSGWRGGCRGSHGPYMPAKTGGYRLPWLACPCAASPTSSNPYS